MTIYALSSGPGLSGIAVIRVSGSDTLKVLKNMTYLTIPDPKVASLRKFINPKTKEIIDEGILLWFPGPESYTGEDMAEFHIHGSKAVIEAMSFNCIPIVSDAFSLPEIIGENGFVVKNKKDCIDAVKQCLSQSSKIDIKINPMFNIEYRRLFFQRLLSK